ncbi:MAG: hypothetical protein ACOZIN_21280 [Myxococcota bacterium]
MRRVIRFLVQRQARRLLAGVLFEWAAIGMGGCSDLRSEFQNYCAEAGLAAGGEPCGQRDVCCADFQCERLSPDAGGVCCHGVGKACDGPEDCCHRLFCVEGTCRL